MQIEEAEPSIGNAALDGPILCSSLDQHTRLGRQAMKHWLQTTPELAEFLAQHVSAGRAEKVVGMALFHIEGSILHRRLTNDCVELLREETERAEMAALGFDAQNAARLYDLMHRHHPALNQIRGQLWAK